MHDDDDDDDDLYKKFIICVNKKAEIWKKSKVFPSVCSFFGIVLDTKCNVTRHR